LISTDDPNVVFFTRQILYLYKKVKIDCPPLRLKEAVNAFVDIESSLRAPNGTWNNDIWVNHRYTFSDDSDNSAHPRGKHLWKTVDDVFASIVPMSEVNGLHLSPRHGPGAVADMKFGGDKYSFPHWPSKLEGVFPWCAFAQHREDLHITEDDTKYVINPSPIEPPAKLIAVPKNYKGPRLIASEPIAHQFLQQGLLKWLRTNLSKPLRTSIDFKSQKPSQDAALLASKDGQSATVDLSSASDRMSCWAVERAFGSNQSLLQALHAVRTRTIIDSTGTDENLHIQLKKFAAQGSAVTFPIQTILYAGLCFAAVLFTENKRVTRRNLMRVARKVRVFGDDIIIPKSAVPVLGILLHSLELKVNVDKTFTEGTFRESCGMDAWCGHNVTPCYLSAFYLENHRPTGEQIVSWVDVSNNAHKKGLWSLSSYMQTSIPLVMRKKMLTSSEEGDGIRFFSFCSGYTTSSRQRVCKHLHRPEAKLLVLRSRQQKKERGSWNDLYQWLIEDPEPHTKWKSGYITKNSVVLDTEWVPVT